MSGRLLVKKRGAGASEPETSQERAVNRRKGEEDWADQLLDGLIGPVPSRLSLLNRAAEWTQHGREREREARSSIDSPRKLAHFSRLSTLFFVVVRFPPFHFSFLYFLFFSLLNRRHLYILCERGTCAVPTLRSFVDTDVSWRSGEPCSNWEIDEGHLLFAPNSQSVKEKGRILPISTHGGTQPHQRDTRRLLGCWFIFLFFSERIRNMPTR